MQPKGILAAIVALAVGLVAGIAVGRAGGGSGAPEEGSVDAGFARDMQTHHDQAVQMSLIIRDGTDDADVRQLAYDIARTQSHQSGQMAGWLQVWGLPATSSEPTMAWMEGHEHGGSDAMSSGSMSSGGSSGMPGMASAEELKELEQATGEEAEVLYLQLMIRHHEGGVPMAQTAVDAAETEPVRTLAQSIIDSQTVEVETMTEMLEARDGEPLPSP
ncbi:DUF305 domain-containing protein [Janibacter alkaliphilus]|uniref:Uncharacterized protein (DUF305 family) n=1 Tax=Janibacter alkaliphilus TaxID=1069963 RepID=A0A852X0K3_9MICO|nr:DUF305 domain-containing protein [Janibacter alkaliphilus]NYG36379.1 uncharacterized protein (DUF305 family) [Janibacter alkaliphilus]